MAEDVQEVELTQYRGAGGELKFSFRAFTAGSMTAR